MQKANRGEQAPQTQNAPSTPSGPTPTGYRFPMSEMPTYKSGAHVFSKGPHREKWDGWKWDDLARCPATLELVGEVAAGSALLKIRVAAVS